jgi:hypothetical protein
MSLIDPFGWPNIDPMSGLCIEKGKVGILICPFLEFGGISYQNPASIMGIFVTALIVPKMDQERTVNLASSDYL